MHSSFLSHRGGDVHTVCAFFEDPIVSVLQNCPAMPTFYANQITYLRQIVTNHHSIALFFHESFLCALFYLSTAAHIYVSIHVMMPLDCGVLLLAIFFSPVFVRGSQPERKDVVNILGSCFAVKLRREGRELCADGMNYCENLGPWGTGKKWNQGIPMQIGAKRCDAILVSSLGTFRTGFANGIVWPRKPSQVMGSNYA